MKICLEHNNSVFANEHYLQIHRTAMGPKNACSYADLAMGIIDEQVKTGEIKPNLWWRYRDDIFDLWTLGMDKLVEFTEFINSLHSTIKFTLVFSEASLNMLDLTLNLVDGFIRLDVYSKPTDNHLYLQRDSAHPQHCIKAIPFGIATRLRRNCSTDECFMKRSEEYKKYLTSRGYKSTNVKRQFDKVRSVPREDLLSAKTKEKKTVFPLVVDFNPRLPDIGKIIKNHLHLLHESPELLALFPPGAIIPSFRRPKSIKDLLSSKRHRVSKSGQGQSPGGCFKCERKCDLCNNYLQETNNFESCQSGKRYSIKQNIKCTSHNVIYLITCNKCSVQYIGSTSTELKVRFRNHKSAMLTNKKTCEVAVHYNSMEHCLSDFSFIGIEQINNNNVVNTTDKRLLTREAYWSAQLCTLKPYGLNKRCEFRSKNRINYS